MFQEKKIFYIFVYYKWNDRVIPINVNELISIVLSKVKRHVLFFFYCNVKASIKVSKPNVVRQRKKQCSYPIKIR